MERIGMERREQLKDKQVSIYFDDGSDITRKDGIAVDLTDSGIIFKESSGQLQFIPFSRVIRIVEKSSFGGH